MSWKRRLKYFIQILFYGAVLLFLLGPAQTPLNDQRGKIRAYTRSAEFDFVEWTIDAILTKVGRATLDTTSYLTVDEQRQVVLDYIDLMGKIFTAEDQLSLIYTDPNQTNPEEAAEPVRQELSALYARREELGPLAEAVLQNMLGATAAEVGLTVGGQPVPPVMFHSTPLPYALIVSPRDEIYQFANLSLETDMILDARIQLEEAIAEDLEMSALVVPVGGVGTYPTMIAQTTNLNWLAEVVAHEWMHNYLTLRPLGIRYFENPELQTINETTANIAGKELGAALILKYFPEFAPPPPVEVVEEDPVEGAEQTAPEPTPEPDPPVFDYYAEMHETRVTVDELLAQGKIDEAEAYMEARRVMFWEQGYRIRKLNQAYFAFYGSYADRAVGSAGEDPVGAAVRQLRSESDDLYDFITRISKVTSFEHLLALLSE